jgi:phosphotriesterase-related protein
MEDKDMPAIRTVNGDIDPDHLGITLMHEHIYWDQSCYLNDLPSEASFKNFLLQKMTPEIRKRIFYHMHQHRDNIIQTDEQLAMDEIRNFYSLGGSLICDLSPIGFGRDPLSNLRISRTVGINIVMGTALYIESSHPESFRSMDVDRLAEFFTDEIVNGEKQTGIKAGIIGEIGISDDFTTREKEVLTAAAMAQKATGAALSIHPPIFKTKAHEILDIIEQSGGDLTKTIMGHCDPTLDNIDYHNSIAKRGTYIEFDQFGHECPVNYGPYKNQWLPRDIDRIRAIKKQIDLGNKEKILISQDICFKYVLKKFGGGGYAHIIENLLPYFIFEGISQDDINTIMIGNPKRALSIDPIKA